MSRVYVCDVCNKVTSIFDLHEFNKKTKNRWFFTDDEVTTTIHICEDCWDRIKKEVGVNK